MTYFVKLYIINACIIIFHNKSTHTITLFIYYIINLMPQNYYRISPVLGVDCEWHQIIFNGNSCPRPLVVFSRLLFIN